MSKLFAAASYSSPRLYYIIQLHESSRRTRLPLLILYYRSCNNPGARVHGLIRVNNVLEYNAAAYYYNIYTVYVPIFFLSLEALLLFLLHVLHYIHIRTLENTNKPYQETNPESTSEVVFPHITRNVFGRSFATEERNRDTGGEIVFPTSSARSAIVRPAVATSQILLHGNLSIAVQERSTKVSTELVTGIVALSVGN